MSVLSSQLVWLLISYLATKLASKTWGRMVLKVGAGYLAAKAAARSETHTADLDRVRPLTDTERERLNDDERRAVDHG